MTPPVPAHISQLIDRLDTLSQWERAELGRRLRELGWTYREIGDVVGAAKSTIAGWCRDIELTSEQIADIRCRTGSQRGVPRDTQWRRRKEREVIRERAARSVASRLCDAAWLGGTVLYWAEGFKTENALGMANSDPDLLRAFIRWTVTHHSSAARFTIKLNLHRDNSERDAVDFWSTELGLGKETFRKTYLKPDGTGHRKNHLYHGVAQVRMRQSTDAFLVTMGWIDGLRRDWHPCVGIV